MDAIHPIQIRQFSRDNPLFGKHPIGEKIQDGAPSFLIQGGDPTIPLCYVGPSMEFFYEYLENVYTTFITILGAFPGSTFVLNYIKESYQHDPFRIFLEGLLAIFTIRYMTSKTQRPDARLIPLTEDEIQELIKEWEPEPLVPPQLTPMAQLNLENVPELQG